MRGYAITSYGSQGKTADHVFLCDSAVRATNKQQWYVSISRARKGISIYTRDKLQLRQNAYRLGEESLALDFVGKEASQQIDYTDPVWITTIKQTMDRQKAFRLANQNPSNKINS